MKRAKAKRKKRETFIRRLDTAAQNGRLGTLSEESLDRFLGRGRARRVSRPTLDQLDQYDT